MSKNLVDYTAELRNSRYYGDVNLVSAQGKNKNFLALFKVLEGYDPSGRAKYFYQLEYRWLSSDCTEEDDESYVCVLGREVQYYKGKELNKINPNIIKGKANLFTSFQLF